MAIGPLVVSIRPASVRTAATEPVLWATFVPGGSIFDSRLSWHCRRWSSMASSWSSADMERRLEALERNIVERKFIDATPDAGYPRRILQAYRDDCDLCYSSTTSGDSFVIEADEGDPNSLIKALNDLQDQRAVILDWALAALAAGEEET
mgnify:CR=1 FL=1